ncbi:MAG: MlaE family ABC transporter permease [Candidatus Methylomirabilales bacterium]
MGFLRLFGRWFLNFLRDGGRMLIFLTTALYTIFLPPIKWRRIIARIHFIGAKSLAVILLTGAFTGMVMGLQGFYSLRKFGSEAVLGAIVALGLIRELGPVLCALMITGRAGSALTAEMGIMRITEQIDALDAMALSPMRYLVVPTILAGLIVFPLLTAIFNVVGIYGGYLVGVNLMGIAEGTYFGEMHNYVDLEDITHGLAKSFSFGLVVTWVCCYKGFHASYGAEGVSRATTEAVVMSSVLILVWDYFLGAVY